MLKIAHRGYTKHHEDNSLQAFYDAIRYNFDMIELDIQLDKYNNIIIMHDIHINYQFIEHMSYNEIKQQFPNTLLLSTFFDTFDYTNTKLYFDLKGGDKLGKILHHFLHNSLKLIYYSQLQLKYLKELVMYFFYLQYFVNEIRF